MLEVLDTEAGVIALKISGRLDEAELADLVQRVEASLEARDKTHMFIEVENFSGFDLAAFARYLPHGAAMLGKLGRFGRIAVVSDQKWIRVLTRVESALLPGISYEIYYADQRHEALAWVEGRRDRPHPPAITIIETDAPNVIGFELDGTIRAEELKRITAYFEEAMRQEQPLRILGRIKHVGGIEPAGVFSTDYLRMKLHALRGVERYALVGGPAWLAGWAALVDPVTKMEVRHFADADEARAWSWLGATPKKEVDLAA